jgi:hypothetical protein
MTCAVNTELFCDKIGARITELTSLGDVSTRETKKRGLGMVARFEADEWITLSTAERITRCRSLAAEARAMVERESRNLAPHYARIAQQWAALADDMESGGSG